MKICFNASLISSLFIISTTLISQYSFASNNSNTQCINGNQPLKIAFWNVWFNGSTKEYFFGDYASKNHWSEIHNVVRNVNPNVLALSEVMFSDPSNIRVGLAGSMKNINFNWYYFYQKKAYFGDALLTDLPLYSSENNKYKIQKVINDKDSEIRGFINTRFNYKGDDLSIYVTHLTLDKNKNKLQIEELANDLGKDRSRRILLLGDFNNNIDVAFEPIVSLGFKMINKNNELNAYNHDGDHHWYGDRIFYKGFSELTSYKLVNVPKELSDHKLLYAEVCP